MNDEQKIVSIINGAPVSSKKAINQNVIRLLEQALERAKAGEIVAVAVCGVDKNGESGSAFEPGEHNHLLLAAIVLLQHRFSSIAFT